MEDKEWLRCPFCDGKTRTQVTQDTLLINFPLFCPKCKQETLVNVRKLNMSIIKESDAQAQEPKRRRADNS